jgi:biotin-dependent carboxylase-like uncharacterized protein
VIANALVGNDDGMAGLEVALGEVELQATTDRIVAATGAIARLLVGDRSVPCWTATAVRAGDRIRTLPDAGGRFGYLAVAGGIDVPPLLGSRSTYLPTSLGGLGGRRLHVNDVLPIGRPERSPPALDRPAPPPAGTNRPIRLCPGPQEHLFTTTAFDNLTGDPYRLSPTSDRMGSRLTGRALPLRRTATLPSEGTAVGAVQVPDDGQPIVILADGPTVGGYPKIGVVARADLGHFVQIPLGGTVRFEWVSIRAAQRAARQAAEGHRAILTAIRRPG